MIDGARELERRGFYRVPKENRVVVAKEITDDYLTVEDITDGTLWTLNRETFDEALGRERIIRVSPNWEPYGRPVEV